MDETRSTTSRRSRCFGGLMLAGAIVTGIGLALIVGDALHLPRHWQTVAVGLVLLAAGAIRRASSGGGS